MRAVLLRMLFIFLLLWQFPASTTLPAGGIEVPGRTVPILRLLENYAASCTPNEKKDFSFEQLSQLMQSLNAEEVAKKIYNSLFFSIADVNIEQLMGKWHTVVDSRSVHEEQCTVFHFDLLTKAEYTATFSLMQYSVRGKKTVMYEGYGRLVGPDPGELLISTGHPSDPCPYVPVRLGGLKADGSFDYIILSQPLKFPTMVLARDRLQFQKKYRKEVYDFCEKFGFLSPVSALNTRLHFVDAAKCTDAVLSFSQLPPFSSLRH